MAVPRMLGASILELPMPVTPIQCDCRTRAQGYDGRVIEGVTIIVDFAERGNCHAVFQSQRGPGDNEVLNLAVACCGSKHEAVSPAATLQIIIATPARDDIVAIQAFQNVVPAIADKHIVEG